MPRFPRRIAGFLPLSPQLSFLHLSRLRHLDRKIYRRAVRPASIWIKRFKDLSRCLESAHGEGCRVVLPKLLQILRKVIDIPDDRLLSHGGSSEPTFSRFNELLGLLESLRFLNLSRCFKFSPTLRKLLWRHSQMSVASCTLLGLPVNCFSLKLLRAVG